MMPRSLSFGPHFEVLTDCPHCRVESAVVEVFDFGSPLAGFGVAMEARCRFCGGAWEGRLAPEIPAVPTLVGRCPACRSTLSSDAPETHRCDACGLLATRVEVRPAVQMDTTEEILECLHHFAREDDYPDVAALLDDAFLGQTAAQIQDAIRRGAPVPTSFDAFHFLFGHVSSGPVRESAAARADDIAAFQEDRLPNDHPPDPRAVVYPIVSVMAADGDVRPEEERFVSAFLTAEGQPPLRPEEIRVHRPLEVERHIPRTRRREIVELMIQLAAIDGTTDTSELRIAKAYANAWGIPEDTLIEWIDRYTQANTRGARRFLLKLKSFFFAPQPARAVPSSDER